VTHGTSNTKKRPRRNLADEITFNADHELTWHRPNTDKDDNDDDGGGNNNTDKGGLELHYPMSLATMGLVLTAPASTK
jgi:hypothetical protein